MFKQLKTSKGGKSISFRIQVTRYYSVLFPCTDVQPAAMPYAQFPVSGPPKPKKLKLAESFPEHVALPYGVLNTQQYHTPPRVQIIGRDLDSILLCSHELMLPDLTTLHTRMLLGAWEAGLEGVSEEAAQLLMLAIEVGRVFL